MNNFLKIKTKDTKARELDDEEELMEPVSPSGLYFNSSFLSIYNLAVLEAETPIGDDVPALQMVKDLFLPVNPRFSAIMTVNDVISGIVFLAIRLYIQEKSQGTMRKTRTTALVIFNIRDIKSYKSIAEMTRKDSSTPWGNQISILQVEVPNLLPIDHDGDVKYVNPLDFVFAAKRIIKRKRNSIAVYLSGLVSATLHKIRGAQAVSAYIQRELSNTSFTITNVIGPVEKMALSNIQIKGLYFNSVGVPQSLVVAVLSYMQTIRISLAIEEGHIDRERLVHYMNNAFQLILDAAMKKSN